MARYERGQTCHPPPKKTTGKSKPNEGTPPAEPPPPCGLLHSGSTQEAPRRPTGQARHRRADPCPVRDAPALHAWDGPRPAVQPRRCASRRPYPRLPPTSGKAPQRGTSPSSPPCRQERGPQFHRPPGSQYSCFPVFLAGNAPRAPQEEKHQSIPILFRQRAINGNVNVADWLNRKGVFHLARHAGRRLIAQHRKTGVKNDCPLRDR